MSADHQSLRPGLYVHVPFCAKRCDYCDFVTYADRDHLMSDYVEALCTHLQRAAPSYNTTTFSSVFVGGGTPTYLPPELLAKVCDTIRTTFSIAPSAEWTVEANPETVSPEIAAVLAETGPNRVSLGAQSFDPSVLQILGRWHDPDSVATAVERLRKAGIPQISTDLIFGTPGETDQSWASSLSTALGLGVNHLSAYALTVEANTPYARRVRHNNALAPNEDIQAERMEQADNAARDAGFKRYEISNWAQPGAMSEHNLVYWRGGQWAAFGCGAHGAWDIDGKRRRYWLIRDPGKYIRTVQAGDDPVAGDEWPTPEEQRLERLMMGLRILEGIPRADIEPLNPQVLEQHQRRGWLTVTNDTIALSAAGFPMADAIIRSLA